jgi:hypothetical protein
MFLLFLAQVSVRRMLSAPQAQNVVTSTKEKFQLFSGICLERFPRLTQPLNDFEKRYLTLLEKIEFESSLLSSHELKHIEDL